MLFLDINIASVCRLQINVTSLDNVFIITKIPSSQERLITEIIKKKKNPTRKTFLPQSMVLNLLSSFAHLILMSWHCLNANDD